MGAPDTHSSFLGMADPFESRSFRKNLQLWNANCGYSCLVAETQPGVLSKMRLSTTLTAMQTH